MRRNPNYRRHLFFVADFLDRDRPFDADDLEARLAVDASFLPPRFLVELFFFAPVRAEAFLAARFFVGLAFLLFELDPNPTNSAIRETIPFFFVVLFRAEVGGIARPC